MWRKTFTNNYFLIV